MDIVSTISSIKKATSVNKKKEIIRENKNNRDFADILFYAFNPSFDAKTFCAAPQPGAGQGNCCTR